jgi:hypothetical protein
VRGRRDHVEIRVRGEESQQLSAGVPARARHGHLATHAHYYALLRKFIQAPCARSARRADARRMSAQMILEKVSPRNSKSKITTADHTEEAITTGEAITTEKADHDRGS